MTKTTFGRAGLGKLAAVGIAAALTVAAVPASALPLGGAGLSQVVKSVPAPVENVRCSTGCAVGIGVGAGLLTGAIIGSQVQRQRNYDYDQGYQSEPSYYGRPGYTQGPGGGRCWVEVNSQRGTGYWTNC